MLRGNELSDLPCVDPAQFRQQGQELRNLAMWSEGRVWCSPERQGAMTGIMKAQIDWIPLSSARLLCPDDLPILEAATASTRRQPTFGA